MEPQQELVLRARGGDADAFAALVRSLERMLLAVAYGVLADAEAARDVVQESLLAAWRRLDTLNDASRVDAWLASTVRRRALDELRRRPRRAAVPLDDAVGPAAEDDAALEDAEQAACLDAALHELDELTRSVVVLRYYEDMGSREIGQIVGLSPAAVDMRLSRARTRLRQRLEAAGVSLA